MMYAEPPIPSDIADAERIRHTRLRRRMLEGTWDSDLKTRQMEMMGSVRSEAIGEPSLAICVFRSICRSLAALYEEPYRIMHDRATPEQLAELSNRIRLAGMFGLMPRFQMYVIGLREMLMRVHADEDGRLHYRPVPPDMIRAWSTLDAPEVPVVIWESRARVRPGTTAPVWTLDVLDISNPDAPRFGIWLDDGSFSPMPDGEITAEFLTGAALAEWQATGWFNQWRYSNGRPFLPAVMFHADRNGDRLFDPYEGRELVDASLDIAVLQQMLIHTFKDASWPQRYAINVRPLGADLMMPDDAGKNRRFEVVADPATVLMLETSGDAADKGQPMIGQWQPGGNIAEMEETLANMIARIASDADVPPSDLQRLGGTARSGAAISLTNEGKRRAQRRFMAAFRDSDERLVAISATILNRATGSTYPEWGYRTAHVQVPLSSEEQKAKLEYVKTQMDLKLIGPIEAYKELHPGVTDEEARRAIENETSGAEQNDDTNRLLTDMASMLAEARDELASDAPDLASVGNAIEEALSALSDAYDIEAEEHADEGGAD